MRGERERWRQRERERGRERGQQRALYIERNGMTW